jgi:peptidoglycan/xylan/chitin deacetylase (PgdA/CDA1 family)
MTVQSLPWPEVCSGAVSLTFDDGHSSQLAKAVPLLEGARLRGTFYLNPGGEGDLWRDRLAAWRHVTDRGHEIGNHTLSHPCPNGYSLQPTFRGGLEDLGLEDLEDDILRAEERLREAFPEHGERSFCYPCYMSYVGSGPTRQSYVPVVARHFLAARGLGERANNPYNCDLHYLHSWDAARRTGAELIGLVERSVAQGRWGILTFHGLEATHLPVAPSDFRELVAHLDRHRDRIWTAPLISIAQRVIEWRTARPE